MGERLRLAIRLLGLAGLALIVAIVYTFLHDKQERGRNRRDINRLACQVVDLGGQPVGGVTCKTPKRPPTATPSPAVSPTPFALSHPVSPGPSPAVSPPSRTRPSPRPPAKRPVPNPSPSRTPSPSPSPTCVRLLGQCLPVIGTT